MDYQIKMQKYHEDLRDLLKANSGKNIPKGFNLRYLGNEHVFYGVKTLVKRNIARDFYKSHKDLSKNDFFDLLDRLYKAPSYEEKTLASELVFFYKNFQSELTLAQIDKWLSYLIGWAEVDTLCQSKLLIPFLEKDFKGTSKFIHKLSNDLNINKRRASLVLLVKPASHMEDKRIFDLAIEIIERLKAEKPVLITKAISWLLRALSVNHKLEVKKYIEENKDSLPKIAVRETLKKIKTGKK